MQTQNKTLAELSGGPEMNLIQSVEKREKILQGGESQHFPLRIPDGSGQ